MKYNLVIFDLDNTLYDEDVFLLACYRHLAGYLSHLYDFDQAYVEKTILNIYQSDGRQQLFQKLLLELGLKDVTLATMLEIFRAGAPKELPLFSWVQPCFVYLQQAGVSVSICTNGNVEQQKKKINSLRLDVADVVYANAYSPKPAPDALLACLERANTEPELAVFVGDAGTDALAAKRAGIAYIDKEVWMKTYENL